MLDLISSATFEISCISYLLQFGEAFFGGKLINLKEGDAIAAVAKVMKDDDDVEDISDIDIEGDAIID